jgi:AraC family transcriptional regulator, regulatory protein of adaptative response / DNA-3-methyladenine glycosylase II
MRTIELNRHGSSVTGWISVKHAPQRYAIEVTMPMSLTPVLAEVLARVRRMFDLASRPDLIDLHLGDLAAGLPGLRVPGAFDGFEVAAHAIVGQRIPVANARAILSRIAEHFGTRVAGPFGLVTTFPSAAVISELTVAALQDVGIGHGRAQALIAVANEVSSGRIVLEPLAPLEETLAALSRIHGIGEWALQYIAMRALAWPNAFPDDDTVLKKQLGYSSASALNQHADRWQPWRAYATLHIWRQHEAPGTASMIGAADT